MWNTVALSYIICTVGAICSGQIALYNAAYSQDLPPMTNVWGGGGPRISVSIMGRIVSRIV